MLPRQSSKGGTQVTTCLHATTADLRLPCQFFTHYFHLFIDLMRGLFMVVLILISHIVMLLFKICFKRNKQAQIAQATSGGDGHEELVTGREKQSQEFEQLSQDF